MPSIMLNQNNDDLSISLTSCSRINACPNPLSIRIVEKARNIDIILTNPNSEGGRNWAIMKVQSICIPIFENLSTILHIVLDIVLFVCI